MPIGVRASRAGGVCAGLLLLIPTVLRAQFPNIQVSAPGSTDPEEVTIAINPADPLNLAAGANITYYYYSFDGGLSWSEGTLSSSLGVWGDPCVVFDANGDLYYSHLSNPPAGSWLDRIVVQKSTDGGVTWSDGAGVGLNPPRDQDKEWMAVDRTGSPWHDNLYLAWTQFDAYGDPSPLDSTRILFSRSSNGGLIWSAPIRIGDAAGTCLDGDDAVEGSSPAVGPEGEVYVTWAGHEVLYFDRSTDGGATFGADAVIATQPGGWDFSIPGIYRCNGFPVTACDVSNSPYRGNVYVCWSDQRNGTDNTDVFFMRSTDGGVSWGNIVRVNDDAGAAQQFFPWMTVDPGTGRIYVVFYDRRATTGNATEVWMARSVDGGQSFYNFRISQSAFTPTQSVFFGDYINVAALDGKVYPIWMRMDAGILSVWMSIIDDGVGGIDLAGGPDASTDLALRVPNPWRAGLPIRFALDRHAIVDATVYDPQGRRVAILARGPAGAGEQEIYWNAAGVPPGVYLVDVRAGRLRSSAKVVVLN